MITWKTTIFRATSINTSAKKLNSCNKDVDLLRNTVVSKSFRVAPPCDNAPKEVSVLNVHVSDVLQTTCHSGTVPSTSSRTNAQKSPLLPDQLRLSCSLQKSKAPYNHARPLQELLFSRSLSTCMKTQCFNVHYQTHS